MKLSAITATLSFGIRLVVQNLTLREMRTGYPEKAAAMRRRFQPYVRV